MTTLKLKPNHVPFSRKFKDGQFNCETQLNSAHKESDSDSLDFSFRKERTPLLAKIRS